MYLPTHTAMDEHSQVQFIQRFPFAALIDDSLTCSQLPLLIEQRDDILFLCGHFARANPQWRSISGSRVLCLFQGPHAYISPSWYEQQPAVPTWNYASVQVHGILQLTEVEKTRSDLYTFLQRFETSTIDEHFIERLLPGIVGFNIKVENIAGKNKLGQHRSEADQRGVAAGLRASGSEEALSFLRYLEQLQLDLDP